MMGIEAVRDHFKRFDMDGRIMEFEQSSATVEQAAAAIGVVPVRIAKTISLRNGEGSILIVTAGDTKIDNKKFREEFGFKARMLAPDEVLQLTGHAIGGVCPFGLQNDLNVYLDLSMKRFTSVFPACGSTNSAIELTCDDLFVYSNAVKWVDVCKSIEA